MQQERLFGDRAFCREDASAMLSRTAENLYWLARYVERAENTARIIDAASRLTYLPATYKGRLNDWEAAIAACGADDAFFNTHCEASKDNVVRFLAFDSNNPSSIRSCFKTARSNARAVRTALTSEAWETLNDAYHRFKRFDGRDMNEQELSRFLREVKEASLRFHGTAQGTMLRNDGYIFMRLGLFLERADATARILDVKYHLLLPKGASVGGGIDYFQWASILRSVSALRSYHWVYKDKLKPWLVADLLVLRPELPRSIAACYQEINSLLDRLANRYGRQGPAQRLARDTNAHLTNVTIDEIFQDDLHAFLEEVVGKTNRLSQAITQQYLV